MNWQLHQDHTGRAPPTAPSAFTVCALVVGVLVGSARHGLTRSATEVRILIVTAASTTQMGATRSGDCRP